MGALGETFSVTLGTDRLPAGVSAGAIPAATITITKALFMTVWCPDSRSVESNCGIPRG